MHWFLDNRMAVAWFGHPENDEENEVVLEVITIETDSNRFTLHGIKLTYSYDVSSHFTFAV